MTAPIHIPVLLDEVIAALAPRDGGVYVDGTFGVGGYSRALLETADCRVYGIDRDPAAIDRGRALAQAYPGRLEVIEGRFGDMDVLLRDRGIDRVDGVALDVGVSSPQIDEPERGFSFRFDGPLDMRMGRDGPTAADVVNHADESELADIIYQLGEERMARRVARAIVAARREQPIARTAQLADIVRSVVPRGKKGEGIDPATRSFQALRIHVNDELGELRRGLSAAESLLAPGGRLAVVSFHSLEDREVKAFLKERSSPPPSPSRHTPVTAVAAHHPSFRLLSRKPVDPSEAEARNNPRARSARLRAAERTEAPAFPAPGKEAA
ncbi:16S rRNA (cytosine(1402)-N(4))-methyltransferase RsmH [Azospirillum sp. TSO35-2]|uniref:16S rRNA (cytosine(1402)-N(4))-methyltransferase RsmH n=1 Tax=Azospirillum sp. TSO35-2 TaxID=716796 RepID=UPI000D618D0C|nr:16S rRNA (cytosine(1402)-N(4))-methyltransferase RsmH [Azospirillum sp. TSO35-2]PWC33723.1 16S rRNA methyltransferase [Azospirillum sp. TSO35-2]